MITCYFWHLLFERRVATSRWAHFLFLSLCCAALCFPGHKPVSRLFVCSVFRFSRPKSRRRWRCGERCKSHPSRQTWVITSYRIPRDLRTRIINGWGGKCLLGIFVWFSSLMFSLHFFQSKHLMTTKMTTTMTTKRIRTTRSLWRQHHNIHSCVSNEAGVITGSLISV